MTSRSACFFAGVLGLVLILTSVGLHFLFRVRRSSRSSWESLVKKLVWVHPGEAAETALDLPGQPGESEQLSDRAPLHTSLLLERVGGLQGLEILKNNSAVMLDLATYLLRWHPEALAVAEEPRLNARELQRHVSRLRRAAKAGQDRP
jgi:hypothetical protein